MLLWEFQMKWWCINGDICWHKVLPLDLLNGTFQPHSEKYSVLGRSVDCKIEENEISSLVYINGLGINLYFFFIYATM